MNISQQRPNIYFIFNRNVASCGSFYRKDTHMKLFCVCGRITKRKPTPEILLRKVLFFYD